MRKQLPIALPPEPKPRGKHFRSISSIRTAAFGVLLLSTAGYANVFHHVPEATEENYQILYVLDIPENAAFRNSTPVPYSEDNSATVPDFDRVAYYLQLTDSSGMHWVYASMDAFTTDPVELGLPHNVNNPVVHQRPVENLNILSNVSSVTTGTFLDGGHLEMWPSNYSSSDNYGVFAASNSRYDWGDSGASTNAGYGSFQVHNTVARQTVFAYNNWGTSSSEDSDIGIGNQPRREPDWTFAENAGDYLTRQLVVLVRPRTIDLHFSELPKNRQLYSRDVATNLATVPISGEERFGGYESISLRMFRNGVFTSATEQPLVYNNGSASFSFSPEIPAELARYDFEIWLHNGSGSKLAQRVRDVVAGDAFIVYGQSNAESWDWDPDRSANEYASQWIVTFGQNGDNGNRAQNILHWVQAEGDGTRDDPGSIGQWPMVLAREIVDLFDIPVAILNGGRSGYGIRRLQKDRDDPDNLFDTSHDDTRRPYNRLRYRAIQAGVADTARALFFYQGEGDNERPDRHANGYQSLREDWADDFPNIERFYVTQVRPGCGITTENLALREAQRRFADIYPRTSVMVTNGLGNHDGCHYLFTNGYEELGWNYARVVARDLYGAPDGPDIDPINPSIANFTDESRTEIRLWLRDPATIHFPGEALEDFHLANSSANITGRTVEGDSILFQLSESANYGAVLEYRSHLGSGPWVTNANGVGMLSFSIPVTPISTSPTGSEISGTNLTRAANGIEAATLTVQLRDENGNPLNESGVSILFRTDLGEFPNGRSTSDPILTTGNGRAQTTLVSNAIGTASVSATVEGVPVVQGAPVSVVFLPGSLDLTENGTDLVAENTEPIANGVDTANLTVQLRDQWGNPLPLSGTQITFETNFGTFSNGNNSIQIPTGSDGSATAHLTSTIAGVATISASIDGQPLVAGNPATVFFQPGPISSGENGTRLQAANLSPVANGLDVAVITAQLRDAFGNIIPASGIEVTFETTLGTFDAGNGVVTATTNPNGLATALLSSTLTGTAIVTATVNAETVTNGSVQINFQAGPADHLTLDLQPVGGLAGNLLTTQPVVSIRDEFGNLVPFATEIEVSIETGLGGILGGTLTATAESGIAIFNDLTFGGIVGEAYTLEFRDTTETFPPVFSEPFNISPGPGTRLVFAQQPSNTQVQQAISPAVKIAIQDAFGNTITGAIGPISIALAENPGNATLSGTTTDVIPVNGIAEFADLQIDRVADGYTLRATSAAELAPAESEPFAIVPGPASQLVFLQQPSDTQVHQTISPAVKIAIQDAFGNTITGTTDPISIALAENPGNATLSGTTTDVIPVDGIAEFADLQIDQVADGYTLRATTATELVPAESEPFAIVPGPGFAAWAAALPEGFRGELDDFGGYGIPNILRYAFDLDPLNPDRRFLPHLDTVETETENRLVLIFQRRTDDPSLIYEIEAASELPEFSLLSGAIIEIDSTHLPAETVTATDPVPISETQRRFLRVRVSW